MPGEQGGRSRIKEQRQRRAMLGLAVLIVLVGVVVTVVTRDDDSTTGTERTSSGTSVPAEPGGKGGRTTSTTEGRLPPYDGWVNPASSGRHWSDTVDGLLTFRGNPTRTWYGKGPVPRKPVVLWSYPGASGGMCGESSVNGVSKTWCGTGWTGQPSVWNADGRTYVAFGAYDKAVHVVDGVTGKDIYTPFPTGDIIKGSVTIDPDGFPLLYSGSRDNSYHVLALDRGESMQQLWSLAADAVSPTKWNNDWDGAGLVIDDYLFEGGENSQFHIVKLNRSRGADGKVTVAPQLVFHAPGWDDELLAAIGDQDVSIENSVAISGNTVYFANSGGLVQGWDITGLADGRTPTRTFRFWTGDDTDASIAIDRDGMLYVASEYERGLEQARTNGQLMKLDPSKPDDPLVWKVDDHDYQPGGMWATPALARGMVYVATNGGRLLGVDQDTGEVRWTKQLEGPTWQSPVVVDDVLLEGDCNGVLHAYDVSKPGADPPELWSVELGGCIESTPAVWKGRIYVGTRAGRFFAIGDR
jgi:hypothetical protein